MSFTTRKGGFSVEEFFGLPRKTTAERLASTPPEDGAIVFDTDLEKVAYYVNGSWFVNSTLEDVSGSLSALTGLSPNHVDFDWKDIVDKALRTFYVDASASPAGDGSIATPWQDFSEITPGNLLPGDLILVAGGTYNDPLVWDGVVGTEENPIYVMANPDTATPANPVLLTGWNDARDQLLPDNFDSSVASTDLYTVDVAGRPIQFTNSAYLHVAGTTWNTDLETNFVVRGWNAEILLNSNSTNCNLYYIQAHNIGTATYDGGNSWWTTDRPGVSIGSDNSVLAYCNIYNNGQDAIQQRDSSNVRNLLIYACWLHTRQHGGGAGTHPDLATGLTFSDVSFNWNRHTDGFQIYTNQDGTSTYQDMQFGPRIDSCVLGPGLTNGLQLGADIADLSNTVIINNLFLMCQDNGVSFHTLSDPKNTLIENNTFIGHTRDQGAGFLSILDPGADGGSHKVLSNIFATYGGTTNFGVKVEDSTGLSVFLNNYKWPVANVIDELDFTSVELNPVLNREPTSNFDFSTAEADKDWYLPTADMNDAGSTLGNVYGLYELSQKTSTIPTYPEFGSISGFSVPSNDITTAWYKGQIYVNLSTDPPDIWIATTASDNPSSSAQGSTWAVYYLPMPSTEKITPVAADRLWVADSEDNLTSKYIQIGNLPSSGGGGGSSATYYILENDKVIDFDTDGVALVDDTASPNITMSHTVEANKIYRVTVYIRVTSGDSNADWRWRFASPTGTTGWYGGSNIEDGRQHATGWDNSGTQFMSQAGNDDYMIFEGLAFVTNAGTIDFQIRNGAAATSQTISKGSYMVVEEVTNA